MVRNIKSLLIALSFVFGCDFKNSAYRCNEEQLEIVKKEIEVCKANDKAASWCYEVVRKSHCTFTPTENKND